MEAKGKVVLTAKLKKFRFKPYDCCGETVYRKDITRGSCIMLSHDSENILVISKYLLDENKDWVEIVLHSEEINQTDLINEVVTILNKLDI